MGANNKECCKGKSNPICKKGNTSFVILILFILMAIIIGGRFL